jgi:hypothetical protein
MMTSLSVQQWWWGMCFLNAVNLGLLLIAWRCRIYQCWRQYLLVTIYVLVAVYRSTFPILWDARPAGCLFSTPDMLLGGVLFDQLLSHVAECSFALHLSCLGEQLLVYNVRTRRFIGLSHLMITIFARSCCWVGVVTTNKFYHVIEESSWTVFVGIHAVLWGGALFNPTLTQSRLHISTAPKLLSTGCLLMTAYVAGMIVVDVPMYYRMWQEELRAGVEYNGVIDGFLALPRNHLRCRQIVTETGPWRESFLWQTCYFGLAPAGLIATLRSCDPHGYLCSRRVERPNYDKIVTETGSWRESFLWQKLKNGLAPAGLIATLRSSDPDVYMCSRMVERPKYD